MQRPDRGLLTHFKGNEAAKLENPEITEIAFRMQHAAPDDTELLERLVRLYASDLYTWIDVLLYYRKGCASLKFEILSILKNVFRRSFTQVNDFHGEENISAWLFGIAYQCVRQYTSKGQFYSIRLENDPANYPVATALIPLLSTRDNLDHLSDKLRLVLLLRYLFEFEIPQIASILNLRSLDVHRKLVAGRKRLITNSSKSHREIQIQSYLDGLLDEDTDVLIPFMQHTMSCEQCKNRVVRINEFEQSLSGNLHSRWSISSLGGNVLNTLIQSILDEMMQPVTGLKFNFKFQHAAWIFGLAVIFIGMSMLFIRFTNVEDEFLKALTTPTQPSPASDEIQPALVFSKDASDIPVTPQYIEPAFSKDGDKLASVFENEIVLWASHPDNSSFYYVHTSTDRFVDTNPLPVPSASDIPVFQKQSSSNEAENLTLEQAAGLIDFPLSIPTHLPENIMFSSASINKDGSILLRFDVSDPQEYRASLYIYEKYVGDAVPLTMTIGAGADIIPTQIETPFGGATAEYVQGDWLWRQTYVPMAKYSDRTIPHEIIDWDFTSKSQRLRWQQNGLLIALYYQVYRQYTPVLQARGENSQIPNLNPIMNQADLEQIASGMDRYVITPTGITTENYNHSLRNDDTGSREFCLTSDRIKPH